jgi:hypothetical protein
MAAGRQGPDSDPTGGIAGYIRAAPSAAPSGPSVACCPGRDDAAGTAASAARRLASDVGAGDGGQPPLTGRAPCARQ